MLHFFEQLLRLGDRYCNVTAERRRAGTEIAFCQRIWILIPTDMTLQEPGIFWIGCIYWKGYFRSLCKVWSIYISKIGSTFDLCQVYDNLFCTKHKLASETMPSAASCADTVSDRKDLVSRRQKDFKAVSLEWGNKPSKLGTYGR